MLSQIVPAQRAPATIWPDTKVGHGTCATNASKAGVSAAPSKVINDARSNDARSNEKPQNDARSHLETPASTAATMRWRKSSDKAFMAYNIQLSQLQ